MLILTDSKIYLVSLSPYFGLSVCARYYDKHLRHIIGLQIIKKLTQNLC